MREVAKVAKVAVAKVAKAVAAEEAAPLEATTEVVTLAARERQPLS